MELSKNEGLVSVIFFSFFDPFKHAVNLAGIDTPHANFQKSKIFKKSPKRGTKNVKNPKFYFFRKINAKYGVSMVILVGIDTRLEFL